MNELKGANANIGATVRADVYDVDPTRARVVLGGWHFERQRPIAPTNVNRIGYEMGA